MNNQAEAVSAPPALRTTVRVVWGIGLAACFIAYVSCLYFTNTMEAVLADFDVQLPTITHLVLRLDQVLWVLGLLGLVIGLVLLFVARDKNWPEMILAAIVSCYVLASLMMFFAVVIPVRSLSTSMGS